LNNFFPLIDFFSVGCYVLIYRLCVRFLLLLRIFRMSASIISNARDVTDYQTWPSERLIDFFTAWKVSSRLLDRLKTDRVDGEDIRVLFPNCEEVKSYIKMYDFDFADERRVISAMEEIWPSKRARDPSIADEGDDTPPVSKKPKSDAKTATSEKTDTSGIIKSSKAIKTTHSIDKNPPTGAKMAVSGKTDTSAAAAGSASSLQPTATKPAKVATVASTKPPKPAAATSTEPPKAPAAASTEPPKAAAATSTKSAKATAAASTKPVQAAAAAESSDEDSSETDFTNAAGFESWSNGRVLKFFKSRQLSSAVLNEMEVDGTKGDELIPSYGEDSKIREFIQSVTNACKSDDRRMVRAMKVVREAVEKNHPKKKKARHAAGEWLKANGGAQKILSCVSPSGLRECLKTEAKIIVLKHTIPRIIKDHKYEVGVRAGQYYLKEGGDPAPAGSAGALEHHAEDSIEDVTEIESDK
jgi:hypothetical protein